MSDKIQGTLGFLVSGLESIERDSVKVNYKKRESLRIAYNVLQGVE